MALSALDYPTDVRWERVCVSRDMLDPNGYEQVTDTAETASRSVETLNVRKGAGSTQSVELLDIDQGFSAGAQGSYAGTGGGFNVSHSGQWGTKQLGEAESNTLRTVDASRE